MVVIDPDWTRQDLINLLDAGEWQAADRVTQALLLAAVDHPPDTTVSLTSFLGRPGQGPGYLSCSDLAQLPCDLLHDLDYLWVRASQGQFGFSVQERLYRQLNQDFDSTQLSPFHPHPFFQAVGWLVISSPRPLAFFRFYDFLNFSLTAPAGHLPALWYWQLSWLESLRVGGFGSGQGGGFGDLARLDALMLRLCRCGQL
jgi:hypothetical protein